MRVVEKAETLDYIKGSNKPHKVCKFYAVFTRFLRRELRYTFLFLCPSIDLSVGVQTAYRAPLCVCRFRVFDWGKARTKAERIGCVIVVRSTKAIESTGKNIKCSIILNPPIFFFVKLNVLDILHDAIRKKKAASYCIQRRKTVLFSYKRITKQWRFKHLYIKNSGVFVWKGILLIIWFRNSFSHPWIQLDWQIVFYFVELCILLL